jgi:sugar-specific transcriptional regulator TrmB
MDKKIELLKKLGLEQREAKLYLTALEFGPTTIAELASKSGIKRTTIYDFIEPMVAKGLIFTTIKTKRKLYESVKPDELEKIIDRQKEIVKELAPELALLVGEDIRKYKIITYEGIEGTRIVYDDTLKQPKGSEILSYSSFLKATDVPSGYLLKDYIRRRVDKKISIKIIAPSSKSKQNEEQTSKPELREVVLVPEKLFPINSEISIYGNKITIRSYGNEKLVLVIESQHIADTQRAIFNLLWSGLKRK